MKFTIEKKELQKLVSSAKVAIEPSEALPAFTCLQIQAEQDNVTLLGFSRRMNVMAKGVANVEENGNYGVAAKSLADVIKVMEGEITVSSSESNRLCFSNGRATVHLNTIDGDQFLYPTDYFSKNWQLNDKGFFSEIEKVSFACAPNKAEERPFLQGIYMNQDSMVGCDGHRMAVRTHKMQIENPVIVPAENLDRVSKIMSAEEDLYVAFDESNFLMHQGNIWASIQLLEGPYPNYQNLIPQTAYDEAQIQKNELLSALKLTSLVTDDQNNVVLQFEPGKLTINANTPEIGDATDVIEAEFPKEFQIAANATYIKQAVERLKEDTVTMEVRNDEQPIIIKEEGYVQVIMPKRLKQ